MYADVQVLDHEDHFVTKQKFTRQVQTLGSGEGSFRGVAEFRGRAGGARVAMRRKGGCC